MNFAFQHALYCHVYHHSLRFIFLTDILKKSVAVEHVFDLIVAFKWFGF